jgi:hypothetical protein
LNQFSKLSKKYLKLNESFKIINPDFFYFNARICSFAN